MDTNVFVYQLDRSDRRKSEIADSLIRSALLDGGACISFQVVQECFNTALRHALIPLNEVELDQYLTDVLSPLICIHSSVGLYRSSLEIRARFRYSYYDSLIVAAALEAGCTRLYTEDMRHGQQIQQLTIENPFLE